MLLKIVKIYHPKFILWNFAFIYIRSSMDFIENYLNIWFQIYIVKSYFICDWIKNGILLETIKNTVLNLYYEIIFLSMTRSRDFIRNY